MTPKIVSILVTVFLSASFVNPLFAQETEDFIYDSKGKRDPFIPLVTRETRVATGLEDVRTIDDVTLEGIVWDPHGDSIAVLNGVIIREGQQVGNVRIKNIEEKRITLFINEVEYKINLIKKGDESGEEE